MPDTETLDAPEAPATPQATPGPLSSPNGVLPEWQHVAERFTAAYPSVPPEEIQRTYEGVRNVSEWRARLANSEETMGSWLYRRAIPVASAQLNYRNAGYVDQARQKILNGQGTPEDAEVIAVQNRLAETDQNASQGTRIAGALASIPATLGEAYLGGIAGRAVGLGVSGAGTLLGNAGRGAATSPLMPSLYVNQAIQNNREAGRNGADWRGFPSAMGLAAIQNGVFSAAGNLGGSAPTGPGALDTARRVFAQGVGAMAVQQGMDIGTSAIDDVAHEVFGQSLNLTTHYGIIGDLWRGNQDQALQDGMTQAVTMFAFAALHEAGNRPTRPQTGLTLLDPDSPNGSGPTNFRWVNNPEGLGGPRRLTGPVEQGMRETRGFLNDLSNQGRTASEAGSEVNRVMTTVQGIVTEAQSQGMSKDIARQRIIDTFPEGPTRDYGLKVIDLVPLGEIATRNAPGSPEAAPVAPNERVAPEAAGARETAFQDPNRLPPVDLGSKGAIAPISEPSTGKSSSSNLAKPEGSWNHTGTKFRDAASGGVEFTGKNGRQYNVDIGKEAAPENVRAHEGQQRVRVRVSDAQGQEAGHVDFYQAKNGHWQAEGLKVAEGEHRGSGVARAMYDAMAEMGEHVVPSGGRTPEGKTFWEKNQAPTGKLASSPAERMMARGRQTVAASAPPTVAPRTLREVRAAPLLKATTTAEVRKVLQEAPGFQSPAEMFLAHGIPPVQQAVLQARFSEAHPTFLQIAKDLQEKFPSPRTGKAYTRAAVKDMEKKALQKLGLNESVHQAVSEGNANDLASRAAEQHDEVVDSVVRGEVSLRKADTKLQDLQDKVQKSIDDLTDRTVAEVNAAKAGGATDADVQVILDRFQKEMQNADQKSRRSLGPDRQAQTATRADSGLPAPPQEGANPQVASPPGKTQTPAATVPGQAARAPSLKERNLSGIVKNPNVGEKARQAAKLELQYLQRAAEQQAAGVRTLYQDVMSRGGLDKAELQSLQINLRDLAENLPRSMWEGRSTKPGRTVKLQDLAMQLQRTGQITVPDSAHAEEFILELLKKNFVLDAGDKFKNEFDRQQRENYEEQTAHAIARANPDLSETELDAKIKKVIAAADEAALRHGSVGSPPEVIDDSLKGDAFEGDEWTQQAPRNSPSDLAGFIHEFLGDESGHLDLDVVRDFAEQYGVGPARNAISHLNTVWRQLAGEGSPRTTDVAPRVGEALERFNNSDIFARFAAPVIADKVLGGDTTPEFDERLGATLTERRLRWERKVYGEQALAASADLQKAIGDRQAAEQQQRQAEQQAAQFRKQGMPQQAATADAYARTFAKASAEAQAAASEASTRSAEAIKARNGVVTLIGMPDSSFATFADYKAAMNDPEVSDAIARHERFAVPVMNDAFRRSKGMDPADPINSPTQIPGSPINLKSARAGDNDTESVIWTKGGTGGGTGANPSQKAGRPPNAKLRRNRYTKQATGNSEGYDISYSKMLEASLVHQLVNAAKAEAVREGVGAGIYKWGKPGQSVSFAGEEARWGQEFNDVKPPKNTQAAAAGETSLYVHPDMAHEFRRAIEIDEPLKFKSIEKAMGAIMAVNLASTAELTYHAKNQLGFLMRTGFNPVRMFRDIVNVIKKEPATMDQLVELARIGTMKAEGFESNNFINKGKYNPLNWGAKLLDLTRKVLLLHGNAAYDRMVKSGLTKPSETGRRNFLNQLGNYNKRSQHKLVKFLRESQIGPFATAGFNYLVQGVRSVAMNPGVKPSSAQARVRLRAGMLLRTVAILAAVELINKALWGKLDGSDDTPLGAIRVGQSAGGQAQYVDIMDLIGLKRGLRVLGLLSLIEGKRKNAPQEKIIDKSAKDMVTALVHPLAGPGAQFVLTAAFGVDASGFHVAQHASTIRHESQARLNVQAALEHANPAFGTLFGHSQAQKPTGQRVMELAGPFGVKTAPPPRR